jgi:hypothetical protein
MVGTKETAAKALETKRANQVKYGRITGLPAETRVRVDTPREKTYHGRRGVVKEHNMGEVGVDFGGALVWFTKDQLIKL